MGDDAETTVESGNGDQRVVLRTDGMTWRALDDQIVVLDLETSLYLNVTGAGAIVWPLLVEGTDLDTMVDAVLEVYEIDAATARHDLEAFLSNLRERTLLG